MVQRYSKLLDEIGKILDKGQKQVYSSINSILVRTYWEIGRQIVEYEQKGKQRAEYGVALLEILSKDLKIRYGRGFSKSNVYLMRLFYIKYPKFQTVSGKLSWSHYSELLSIEDDLPREFYERQCTNNNWSIRELKRQINSALFHRMRLSKDKRAIRLSKQSYEIKKAEDIVKDPYILEFLNIPENNHYSEKELEQKIINNMQMFLLELGKGFTFVGRQYRITLGNNHYYVDLVFYHKYLKCHVLIDLKIGKVDHSDIGQMNMYLNYFLAEEEVDGNPPIGIILSTEKDEILVKYALGGISNKLFVSKYKLYLPTRQKLEEELKKICLST